MKILNIEKDEDKITAIAAILQLIDENELNAKVIQHIGYDIDERKELIGNIEIISEDLINVNERGILNSTISGYIYNKDMHEFFDENKEEIFKLIDEKSNEYGYKNDIEMMHEMLNNVGIDMKLSDFTSLSKSNYNLYNQANNEIIDKCLDAKRTISCYIAENLAYEFHSLITDKENIQTKYKQQAIKELNEYNNENEVKVSRKKGKEYGRFN